MKNQISGLKSGCGRLKKFEQWSLTREFLKWYLTEKQNGYLQSGCFDCTKLQNSPFHG